MSTAYVLGAGMSGLAAAVALAEKHAKVVLIEGAPQAGGRCRSYYDPQLDTVIDNGNHLVLSGNHSVHTYLKTIGALDHLAGPDRAEFNFAHLHTGERWTIRPNDSALAVWILDPARRVPGTSAKDYLALLKLLLAKKSDHIRDVIACRGPLWEKLLRPFLLAALNTEPEIASAALAGAVIRESLAKGGTAYRPRIAHPTLASAFVDPALAYLKAQGADVQIGRRVRAITYDNHRPIALVLPDATIPLAAEDVLILAVPPWALGELLPGVTVPTEFRSIVNAHFRIAPPAGTPLMTGVIGGTVEWLFAFEDRVSITVSGADAIVDEDRESLATRFWAEVATVMRLPAALPPWQIVKERRATFAATPEQAALRPPATTQFP
ncbi:MAG TPA: hydroxysqualene dehydroxylase HpnE, partial [Rhizomicrobium sp.]|nr:hydroxysqualene dehydroxylase HpnE [Rhizomicrobium sp.]